MCTTNQLNKTQQITKDLLTKYDGITTSINHLFAYHYEQIQRELRLELNNLPDEGRYYLLDHFICYMEEMMQWPSCESNDEFINSILF